MQQRRFIVGILVLTFFIITGGLTSCGLFEQAAGSNLTNAIGMSEETGPGSGSWIPPVPQNRSQCLQLHAIGVELKDGLDRNTNEMELIRTRCVDENGEFLPGVDKAECTLRFNEFYEPAQLILTDLLTGGARYSESCTAADDDSTLPAWPLADGEKDEEPKATVEPEATKEPADTQPSCCWCLTCTHRLDTGYMMRPLIISPSG